MTRRVIVFSLLALVLPWRADAHRLDELLQATRISVDTAGIELELALSPGVDVAAPFIRSIDANRDGSLDGGEVRDFSREVARALSVSIDDRVVPLTLRAWHADSTDALRQGVGAIRLVARGSADASPGRHVLTFGNRFQLTGSVYLVNALTPADRRIRLSQPLRDPQQRTFTIDYVREGSRPAMVWPGAVAAFVAMIAIVLTARSRAAGPRAEGAVWPGASRSGPGALNRRESAREIPRQLAGGNRTAAAGVLSRPQR